MKRTKPFIVLAAVMIAALLLPVGAGAADGDIPVMLDDKVLSFTDAAPQMVSDRVMLPFRAVFEALGAEVGWDAETATVSAIKDGRTVAFVVGSKTVSVTENGESRTFETDVAPFIDGRLGRTYVPTRFAAEAMGYTVGWDSSRDTVVIIDGEKLKNEADAKFTVFNDLIKKSAAMTKDKTLKSDSSFSGRLVVDKASLGADEDIALSLSGTQRDVAAGTATESSGSVSIDVGTLRDTLLADPDMDDMQKIMLTSVLNAIDRIDYGVRGSLDGDLYITLGSLNSLIFGIDNDSWVKLELGEMASAAQMSMGVTAAMVGGDVTVGDIISIVIDTAYVDSVDAYKSIKAAIDAIELMLGDANITTSTRGNTTVYSSRTTGADLAGLTGEDMGDLAFDFEYSFEVTGEEIGDANVAMKLSSEEAGLTMDMKVSSVGIRSSSVALSFGIAGTASLEIEASSNVSETGESPVLTPPAGASVYGIDEVAEPIAIPAA